MVHPTRSAIQMFKCLNFLYALLSFQEVFRLPLPLSKHSFSHGALHTGSASEWFTPLEAQYKCLNTIQYTGSASEWFTPLEAQYKCLNTIQYIKVLKGK